MTTISSVGALISSKSMTSIAKPDAKVSEQREQQKETCSSACSVASRAMAMAGINFAPAPAKAPEVSYTEGINCDVVANKTGDDANRWWMEEMGYDNPPYLPKSKVQEIELKEDTTFARVYDGENSGMYGGWVMKAADIEGLSPQEIQDKFALPQCPVKMCDVKIPAGTRMRTGLCNPLEGWGNGGGVQFDLMGQRVGEFGNERMIPPKPIDTE